MRSHSVSHSETGRGHIHRWDMPSELVGDTGFEPVTSSVSTNRGQIADLRKRRNRRKADAVQRTSAPLDAVQRSTAHLPAPNLLPTEQEECTPIGGLRDRQVAVPAQQRGWGDEERRLPWPWQQQPGQTPPTPPDRRVPDQGGRPDAVAPRPDEQHEDLDSVGTLASNSERDQQQNDRTITYPNDKITADSIPEPPPTRACTKPHSRHPDGVYRRYKVQAGRPGCDASAEGDWVTKNVDHRGHDNAARHRPVGWFLVPPATSRSPSSPPPTPATSPSPPSTPTRPGWPNAPPRTAPTARPAHLAKDPPCCKASSSAADADDA